MSFDVIVMSKELVEMNAKIFFRVTLVNGITSNIHFKNIFPKWQIKDHTRRFTNIKHSTV